MMRHARDIEAPANLSLERPESPGIAKPMSAGAGLQPIPHHPLIEILDVHLHTPALRGETVLVRFAEYAKHLPLTKYRLAP